MVNELPLVSVITPSFNHARFIRDTIDSVLTQDYPRIELIVVDGGSADGTLDILQGYAHMTDRFRYVSEPDRGQSHAINKGLNMARGSIIGWLNSDDTYEPGAVGKAVEAFANNPLWGVAYGKANYIDEEGRVIRPCHVESFRPHRLFEGCIIAQPAAFLRREVFVGLGGVEESLRFCMDYDLWIRAAKQYMFGYVDEVLANSRLHDECKSIALWADTGMPEIIDTSLRHFGAVSNEWIIEYLRCHKDKDPLWLLQQFKARRIFELSPFVEKMNRKGDRWVPPNFTIQIKADPVNPLNTLIIKGIHLLPVFDARKQRPLQVSVAINGMQRESYRLREGPFILEIPILPPVPYLVKVELSFSDYIVPAKLKINTDTRSLSCLIEEVLPCSETEHQFYRVLKSNPEFIEQWLISNRKPMPFLLRKA